MKTVSKYQMCLCMPILGLLLFVSCNEPTLDSSWRPVNAGESSKYSSYILNGEDVVVAMQNDDQNLYLRIKATNTASQMKMISGLTVWLDGGGKKQKCFGIQYPIARNERIHRRGKPGERGDMKEGGEPRGPGGPGDLERPGGFPGLSSGGKDSMIIIGPSEDDRQVIGVRNEFGISASITHEGGPMIYDLTIPLKNGEATPYAIGIQSGSLISLGIETAVSKSRPKDMDEGDRPKPGGGDNTFGGSGGSPGGFGDGGDWGGDGDWGGGGSGPSGGGPPGGGMGGGPSGGGRGPSGGKGRPGGPEGMKADPIKFWAKIRLAAADKAAQ